MYKKLALFYHITTIIRITQQQIGTKWNLVYGFLYKPTILAPIWSRKPVIDDAILLVICFGVCGRNNVHNAMQ